MHSAGITDIERTANQCSSPVVNSGKIHPPGLGARILSRPRLLELAGRRLQCGHLWITAPPGAGKSVLASDYLRRQPEASPWYVIDSLDSDPAIFFPFLAASFAISFPGTAFDDLRQDPHPEDISDPAFYARRFFRLLFSRLPSRFILVFDNCQEAGPGSRLYELLGLCIEELPLESRLLFLSRHHPPPVLASFTTDGRLHVEKPGALNFTDKETRRLVEIYRPGVNDTDLSERLHAATSGWAAGLTLMLRDREQEATSSTACTLNNTELFNYFTGVVFSDFTDEDRNLLMTAALFPEINPQVLSDLLPGITHDHIFKRLSRNSFFVYSLDRHDDLFQFHPLFRKFLLDRARELVPAQHLEELQRRAAAVLISRERITEAVELLNSAGLWHESARLIKGMGSSLLLRGKFMTLMNWYQVMPSRVTGQDPWLLFIFGNAAIAFNPEKAINILEASFNLFRHKEEKNWALLACASLSNAIINHMSDLSEIDSLIDYMVREVDPENFVAVHDSEKESIANAVFRALVLRRPGHPDLEKWLDIVEQQESMHPAIITHYLWTGRFIHARAALDRIYSSRRKIGSKLMLSAIKAMEVQYYLIMDDAPACCRVIDESLEMIEKSGIRVWEIHFLILGAGCCLNSGDIRKARRFLEKVERNIHRARGLEQSYYHVVKALDALLADDMTAADHHQESALLLARKVGMPSYEIWCLCCTALVAVRQRNYRKAERFFANVIDMAASPGNPWFTSLAHLGLAWLYAHIGREDKVRWHLERGFSIARRHNYLAFFFFLPDMMETVCIKALEHGIESDFVSRFIQHRPIVPRQPPFHISAWPWPVRLYTLGRFSIVVNGKKTEHPGMAQNRPVKLLQAIVALGGIQVSKARLADMFWPDSEGDHQFAALKMTIHRLRRILQCNRALVQTPDYLSLDPRCCWVDSWQFERAAAEALKLRQVDNTNKGIESARQALETYKGPFLAAWQDVPWTFAYREKLHKLHVQMEYIAAV